MNKYYMIDKMLKSVYDGPYERIVTPSLNLMGKIALVPNDFEAQ